MGRWHQMGTRPLTADLSPLACRAVAGDDRAWSDLVRHMDHVLRRVARRYRLSPAEVDDVVQTTWLRAFEHVARLNDPAAIAGWLVVTTRREAMRTLQRGVREVLVDDSRTFDGVDSAGPEAMVIQRERRAAVRGAVRRLSGRQRRLVTSMLASPAPSYQRLSWLLDMPVGSIGPTRERALARLREDAELERAVTA
jgi:RNA polymerase sigma factor (sigma-70 family)